MSPNAMWLGNGGGVRRWRHERNGLIILLTSLLVSASASILGAPLEPPLAFLNHKNCIKPRHKSTTTMPPTPPEITIRRASSTSPSGSPIKHSVSTVTLATVATTDASASSGGDGTLAAGLARLKETVAAVPSRGYVSEKSPTPVEYMPRLTEMCDGPELYVKRDDMLPLAGGGSKTRKLGEFNAIDSVV